MPALKGVPMQGTTTEAPPQAVAQRPRWLWPAIGAGVLAVAVIVGVALASGDDGDSASAATPLETAQAWIARFEAGDIAGYEALMAEDATYLCIECSYGELDNSGPYFPRGANDERTTAGILGAGNGSLNAACSEDGSTVTCDVRMTSAFGFVGDDGQPANEYTAQLTFAVDDGVITDYEHRAFTGNFFDYGRIGAYETWLKDEDPAAHDELFGFGTMLTTEAAQVERHRDLVGRWVAGG